MDCRLQPTPASYWFARFQLPGMIRTSAVSEIVHILEGGHSMTYVICEPCIGVKEGSCSEVCPVDCIYSSDEDEQYYINPAECINCGACLPVCPVNAIYPESKVPEEWESYTDKNARYFETS
jgi:NAD-dependent dihydropyrimidine dehydrogenase PreA subunit